METHRSVEVQLGALLISAVDGNKFSVSRPGRFTHRRRVPGTHRLGLGSEFGLDTTVKMTFLAASGHGTPVVYYLG